MMFRSSYHSGDRKSKATQDLLLISLVAILALILALTFDLAEGLINFFQTMRGYRLDEALVVILVLVVAFAFFSFRRWFELKQEVAHSMGLLHQVSEANSKLELVSRQLLEAQENERRKIAYELHDEIGQVLTAVKLNLQSIRRDFPHSNFTQLEDSIGITEQALQQVRNLALELRPSILDDLGLPAALRWFTERAVKRANLDAEIELELINRIQPEIEITCYRVAQEAVTNVLRHSQASLIRVKLSLNNNILMLQICDNGNGFNLPKAFKKASKGNSLGLLGMQERVLLAGGAFDIQSAPKNGTIVTVQFSLQNPI